jgi:hypothetical protein
MSTVCVVTDTAADVDKRVAEAWTRVEAGLGRVLTASLRQLNAPAAVEAIDAVEAALAVPLPGGTPGQVVRVDVECASWDVLAPSWTQLLVRYAEDLELFAADPDNSTLEIDDHRGLACEWGGSPPSDSWGCVRHGCWTFSMDRHNPCGGGQASVDKDADRRRWDHPY